MIHKTLFLKFFWTYLVSSSSSVRRMASHTCSSMWWRQQWAWTQDAGSPHGILTPHPAAPLTARDHAGHSPGWVMSLWIGSLDGEVERQMHDASSSTRNSNACIRILTSQMDFASTELCLSVLHLSQASVCFRHAVLHFVGLRVHL